MSCKYCWSSVIVGDGAHGKVCVFFAIGVFVVVVVAQRRPALISPLTTFFLVQNCPWNCLSIVFFKGTFPEVSLSFLLNAAPDP